MITIDNLDYKGSISQQDYLTIHNMFMLDIEFYISYKMGGTYLLGNDQNDFQVVLQRDIHTFKRSYYNLYYYEVWEHPEHLIFIKKDTKKI